MENVNRYAHVMAPNGLNFCLRTTAYVTK
jgi:hypothetical protein